MLTHFGSPDYVSELQQLARRAGACILGHRQAATENTTRKPDGSPVTDADREAEQIILAGLKALTPDIPVIAEEKDNPPHLATSGTYWLVDPLDGTQDFVSGGDEFSVNIGLVVDGRPRLGVLYVPAQDDLFYGDSSVAMRVNKGIQVDLLALKQTKSAVEVGRLITSRREAKRLPINDWLQAGYISEWRVCSSAYKFGLVAAGEFDLFLRTGITYEWDTAAGDAILRAVGGSVVTRDNALLKYSKPDFRNDDFIAYNTTCTNDCRRKFFTLINTI